MRTEKIVWKASSLPECVVASVILMTVFLLSEGLYELDDGAHTEGNYTFIYGEIRVEASLTLYDARIQQLVLTAWPVQGGSCIERYHLIRKADGY